MAHVVGGLEDDLDVANLHGCFGIGGEWFAGTCAAYVDGKHAGVSNVANIADEFGSAFAGE